MENTPLITNPAIVLGMLCLILGLVFYTSNLQNKYWKKFYDFLPPLLLCYFLPALLNYPFGLISGEKSVLYEVARDYFLPAALILLCMTISIRDFVKLGPKALIMFFAASVGVMLGAPLALWISYRLMPDLAVTYGDTLWQGLSTIAGSWIGGGANQAAMKEIYQVPQDIFGTMLVIDVIVSFVWMAILLSLAGKSKNIDTWLKADTSSIDALKQKCLAFKANTERIPSLYDLVLLFAITFTCVGISHFLADVTVPFMKAHEATLASMKLNSLTSTFFWIVVISTLLGLGLSMTKARNYDGIGASKWGQLFIYFLVMTIGMQMNIAAVFSNIKLMVIGLLWISFHIIFITVVAKLIKAPFFFLAVGSQANIGGPASAPVVASAFDVSLAPVGVILAVVGYAIGTYGAIITAQLMSMVS
jgi:uncharacterized membrane protein